VCQPNWNEALVDKINYFKWLKNRSDHNKVLTPTGNLKYRGTPKYRRLEHHPTMAFRRFTAVVACSCLGKNRFVAAAPCPTSII
jgi:hypothetical protein